MSAEPVDLRPEGDYDRDSGAAIRPDLVLSDTLEIEVGNGKFSTISADEALALLPDRVKERTLRFARRARSEATLKSYERAWAEFVAWCSMRHFHPLPADPRAVAVYITELADAGQKPATIKRKLSAISVQHRKAGHDSPRKSAFVADTLEGIENEVGVKPASKAPARKGDLRLMIEALDRSRLIGLRDHALLMVGFAGAFRRSELAAFNVSDLTERGDWLYAYVAKSKGDQKKEGAYVVMPWGREEALCPMRALRRWLAAAGITEGPVWRPISKGGRLGETRLAGKEVARIVKRTARAAGLNPESYAGHSLRSGFITTAAEEGVLERHIMRQSRHRSVKVMRGYIDEANLTVDNAAAAILGRPPVDT